MSRRLIGHRRTILDNAVKILARRRAHMLVANAFRLRTVLLAGIDDGWMPPGNEVMVMVDHMISLSEMAFAEVKKFTDPEEVVISRVINQVNYRKVPK